MQANTSTTLPTVSVIIPTWNRKSVFSLYYPKDCLSIFVVDNASDDHTAVIVKEAFSEVHIVSLKTNKGFSGAND